MGRNGEAGDSSDVCKDGVLIVLVKEIWLWCFALTGFGGVEVWLRGFSKSTG